LFREIAELKNLVLSYQRLGEQGQQLHDDVIIPLQDGELPQLRERKQKADEAKDIAGCFFDPSRGKP
jgi:hypothetical protein